MFDTEVNVVYKFEGKWYMGTISGGILKKKIEIKKLSDVTGKDDYSTLKQFLKINKSGLDPEKILEKFKIDRLYVKNVIGEMVENNVVKEIKQPPSQKEWWRKKNKLCIDCVKTCKQSSYATIISCRRVITKNG